ncbi:hypothetical protein P7M41_26125, partial [Vibrio parahaemolyticus]|nr:hypothetical protein [Vibrio parahaemolyticus]
MFEYLQSLTRIHRAVFQQVKGATEDRGVDIPADLQRIRPGEQVYVKVFKRKWDQPRREGPYKVILATPTALKVEGKDIWFHLNHCCRVNNPERVSTESTSEENTPSSVADDEPHESPPGSRRADDEGPSAENRERTERAEAEREQGEESSSSET